MPGRPWTNLDEAEAVKLYKAGVPCRNMTSILRRSRSAVDHKLAELREYERIGPRPAIKPDRRPAKPSKGRRSLSITPEHAARLELMSQRDDVARCKIVEGWIDAEADLTGVKRFTRKEARKFFARGAKPETEDTIAEAIGGIVMF